MHDYLIKAANIVDGRGNKPFTGDIAISNGIITNWFIQRRATALAIVAVGLAVGGLWIPPVTAWLMQQGTIANDWRFALQVLSYILGSIAFVAILLGVTRTPEDIDQHPDGDSANAVTAEDIEPEKADADFKAAVRTRDIWFINRSIPCPVLPETPVSGAARRSDFGRT